MIGKIKSYFFIFLHKNAEPLHAVNPSPILDQQRNKDQTTSFEQKRRHTHDPLYSKPDRGSVDSTFRNYKVKRATIHELSIKGQYCS